MLIQIKFFGINKLTPFLSIVLGLKKFRFPVVKNRSILHKVLNTEMTSTVTRP